MSRTYHSILTAWDGFVDGHRVAGMLTANFPVQEQLVERDAIPALQQALDAQWMGIELYQPLPPGPAVPWELDRLVTSAWDCAGTTSEDPHAVIFPAFALKSLRQRPASIARSRIDDLCRLTSLYAAAQAMAIKPWNGPNGDPIPTMPGRPAAALPGTSVFRVNHFCESVLEAFRSVVPHFSQWTHLDLWRSGARPLRTRLHPACPQGGGGIPALPATVPGRTGHSASGHPQGSTAAALPRRALRLLGSPATGAPPGLLGPFSEIPICIPAMHAPIPQPNRP
jgi:hypothetical protein